MKLLFYVPQMATYGGMERHVCVLAQEASKHGHTVRLLTTSNSLNPTARAALLAHGVDFRELTSPRETTSKLKKWLWLWRETLSAKNTHWDIIYTNGQSALANIVWRAARKSTRIIHHHHTSADASEQATWHPRFRHILATSPEVVGCSQATCNGIAKATGRAHTRFLPYFTACPVERTEVAEKNVPSGDPINIGFIGRLVGTKGVDILCDLSLRSDMQDVTWHIHGSGPEYPAAHFTRFPRVQYHGPYQDLISYGKILRELDAVALFSRHNEGMPLSLIEAMSAGLPWVASNRGGTRELATDTANCVIIDDPNDLPSVIAGTLDLIARIREGRTSRLAQRAVYDATFEPSVVAQTWFRYLETPRQA